MRKSQTAEVGIPWGSHLASLSANRWRQQDSPPCLHGHSQNRRRQPCRTGTLSHKRDVIVHCSVCPAKLDPVLSRLVQLLSTHNGDSHVQEESGETPVTHGLSLPATGYGGSRYGENVICEPIGHLPLFPFHLPNCTPHSFFIFSSSTSHSFCCSLVHSSTLNRPLCHSQSLFVFCSSSAISSISLIP